MRLSLVADEEENDPGEEGRDEEGEQRPAQGITMPVHRHAIRDMNADEIDKQQCQKAAENDKRDDCQRGHAGEETYREILKSSD